MNKTGIEYLTHSWNPIAMRCTPVFVKQLEINGKVTSDPADWPEWARRQEFPKQES